jgi:hypothetical protein
MAMTIARHAQRWHSLASLPINAIFNGLLALAKGCAAAVKTMWSWLKEHNTSISSAAAIIGIPFGLLGLFITICQIEGAKQQLEASTIFTIQSEGRSLFKEVQSDTALYRYVLFSKDHEKLSPEEKRRGEVYVARVIQYFSAIAIQKEAGNIGARFWPTFKEDICQTFSRDTFKNQLAALELQSPSASALLGEVRKCE